MPGQYNDAAGTYGGYMSATGLSEKFRTFAQPLMPLRNKQWVRREKALGGIKGATINFNKGGDLSDSGSNATTINQRLRIPQDAFATTQGSVTLNEYGISVPMTEKYEVLSNFDERSIIRERLTNHMARKVDWLAAAALKTTYLMYTPTGSASAPTGVFDTDGTITTAAQRNLQAADLWALREELVDVYHMPPINGQLGERSFEYVIAGPETLFSKLLQDDDIRADLRWSSSGKGDSATTIKGAQGVWNGFLFLVDNASFARSMDGNSTYTVGTDFASEGVVFGADAIVEITAVAPEIRVKTPEDYNRDRGVAWYGIMGYAIPWGTSATEVGTNHQASACWLTSTNLT